MATYLKYRWKISPILITVMILAINGNTQGVDSSLKIARNNINTYIGNSTLKIP